MSKFNEPRRDVTQTKPLAALDARAQERARMLRAKYGWELYVYHDGPPNAGMDIVGANLPHIDDTREYWRIVFPEGQTP